MELFLYFCSAKNRDPLSLSLNYVLLLMCKTFDQYKNIFFLSSFFFVMFVKYLARLYHIISDQQFVSTNLNY